jgi:hypothetical protein
MVYTTYKNCDLVDGLLLLYPHDTPNGTCLIGKLYEKPMDSRGALLSEKKN